ncbi:type I-C CRISPR-associated protein Cas8c/Csd1 [Tistrella bauzanensis]|uniref:Type I-C CRISPR-associated protein Cas8c/Csd1 n=1 Tax=Tistrella bauzanensis TaxID=657419 RepID=A0ABQ1IDD3_9PROT|nr:type I-C CRISPR-associated protein Cas8c/Csd1 [Tistrella bauzanensis]GGB32988.1 type I-C CRISPR-associated protein Cas8c/Csd1 [Tistrella bauzanensis]
MILQELAAYYDRRIEGGDDTIPSEGTSEKAIGAAIDLSDWQLGGVPVIRLLGDRSGKKVKPLRMAVPAEIKRTSGVAANFLWDKSAYVLGVKSAGKDPAAGVVPADKEFEAFRQLHADALAGTEDAALQALLAFLGDWTPARAVEAVEQGQIPAEVIDANLIFTYGAGRVPMLHMRRAARRAWDGRRAAVAGGVGRCLVTGDLAPVAKLHPSIKGVRGAQSSGASLVSFNLDAFTSYGKSQGGNAPVSESAAFAYGTILNHLLAPESGHRVQIGDATTVFWTDAPKDADDVAGRLLTNAVSPAYGLMDEPAAEAEAGDDDTPAAKPKIDLRMSDAEAQRVRTALTAIAQGRAIQNVEPELLPDTRLYVLGLAPNASRLAVRFWHQDSLGGFVKRLHQHWRDLRLEPGIDGGRPVSIYALLRALSPQDKVDNLPPKLGGDIMRAVLNGGPYPANMAALALMRMRADGNISALRVAMVKAWLVRAMTLSPEERETRLVSLDLEDKNVGYRLGRLFAVLENLQRKALPGLNATIRDRYYGAASATPASIFPVLIRNSTHHAARLRKNSGGLAVWYDRTIAEVIDGLPSHLPAHLTMDDQGRFAIGYFHQRQTQMQTAPDPVKAAETAEPSEIDDDDQLN